MIQPMPANLDTDRGVAKRQLSACADERQHGLFSQLVGRAGGELT
jgi:hypothetical protein